MQIHSWSLKLQPPATPGGEEKRDHQKRRKTNKNKNKTNNNTTTTTTNKNKNNGAALERRPCSFYVPTHAASSFARTASPWDPSMDAATPSLAHKTKRKSCQDDDNKRTRSVVVASGTDYAIFLAQAEADDGATRRLSHPRHDAAAAAAAARVKWSASVAAAARRRDSAYYSSIGKGSQDSLLCDDDGSHNNNNNKKKKGACFPSSPLPARNSGFTRKGTKTLARRLSEYFKPPNRGRVVNVMG